MGLIHPSVSQDHNGCPVFIGFVYIQEQPFQSLIKGSIFIADDRNLCHRKSRHVHRLDL